MATNTVGIDKEVEVNRKENLRDHRLYWIGRRTQDVILSSLALVVLSPVMLATAIAIVVDDPSAGPVFSQERIGRNGKPFKFYKFRSMCPNAEAKLDDLLDQNEMDGPVFKIKDDPRITRVGKFIRKTSLDELPQLWRYEHRWPPPGTSPRGGAVRRLRKAAPVCDPRPELLLADRPAPQRPLF